MSRFIADLHIHSHFSRATSRDLTPEHLELWARQKGVAIVGSGDFTHPGWLQELREKLEPAEPGLYRIKPGLRLPAPFAAPWLEGAEVRFILSGEISSIYKKGERVRKVHNLVLAPDFESVAKIQARLQARQANITSDGRPILGMDCRDLLELALEATDGMAIFIPAHIWTPWFSVLGDKSGFDSIEECYEDLSSHIHAVETGLSSDPPMNRLCSFLDPYTLVSNSDAHSPEKIGREANLFDCELSYPAISSALCTGEGYSGTIEFFPQEGKYHYDGHRKCSVRWSPIETDEHGGRCPVCAKPVTVGVLSRVLQLADRQEGDAPKGVAHHSLIPLREMLAEIWGSRPESRRVLETYCSLLKALGPELAIALDMPPERIETIAGDELAEAMRRMREGRVHIEEGYDGEYGRIRLFAPNEIPSGGRGQKRLFAGLIPPEPKTPPRPESKPHPARKVVRKKKAAVKGAAPAAANPVQEAAIRHSGGPALVIAGPGTGKTHVLTRHAAELVAGGEANGGDILAVTFTNRAAAEMRQRLDMLLPKTSPERMPLVCTFHAFGLSILREHAALAERQGGFVLLDEQDRLLVLKKSGGEKSAGALSACKQRLLAPDQVDDDVLRSVYAQYEERLRQLNAFDLDDLVVWPCWLLAERPEVAERVREKHRFVLVDECQDMNEAQYRLLRLLVPERSGHLYLVGDPDQSIYGFRGSDPGLIRRFLEEYAPVATFRLTGSFRCTDRILKASAGVLRRSGGEALAGLQPGVKVVIARTPSDRSEAEFIARGIEAMVGGVRFFSIDSGVAAGGDSEDKEMGFADFAVLCRTAAQFPALQEAFRNHGIPWQEAEEKPFFRKEPGRTCLEWLRFVLRPGDPFLARMLLERETVLPLTGERLREVTADLERFPKVSEKIGRLAAIVSGKTGEAPDLERLQQWAEPYGEDLGRFLSDAALGRGADTLRPGLESVALLSLHAAKGLEFACVFVAGCEEGLIPYSLFPGRVGDAEEEKRLLYVGMTRARSRLFLTHAARRRLHGRSWSLPRSPFLDTIERDLLELREHEAKRDEGPRQLKLFDLKKEMK